MNFDTGDINISYIGRSELYNVLSSQGIRAAEFKTGVLMYVYIEEQWPYVPYRSSAEIAACIHAAGGYVLHQTDCTILTEWGEENVQMSDTLSQVVQCAYKILEVCKLQRIKNISERYVKIALSTGGFTKMRIINKKIPCCAVFGPAVEELRSAQALLKHGDIVLCPEAWPFCGRQNLTVKHTENEEAVKVRCSKEQQSNVRIHINPKITYLITNKERETFIREFMTDKVWEKIRDSRLWEAHDHSLPEIWPTTIMFVNLQFVLTQTDLRFGHHEVSETIAEQMFRCRGKICDVFFFDEGCIFVCAVGLPGDKRPDKIAQALQAVCRIYETCRQQIDSVSCISVGVATGRVKYEFQKTPLRECCRVSGHTVHKAAVLSLENPGVVSWDKPTKLYSMLPLSTFNPEETNRQHLKMYLHVDVKQMLAHEPELSSGEMVGKRLALANMLTMPDKELEVVKCASVIGYFTDDNFTFELLKYMLPHMNEQELIILLRSLFKAGIFKCASEPRNVSSTTICYCENSCEEYIRFSMEPVWPCRKMSFCNIDEKKMVYEQLQLEETQFHEIHKYCATFLEKTPYHCSKCKAKNFHLRHKVAIYYDGKHVQEIYKEMQRYKIFRRQGVRSRNRVYPTEGNGNDTENFLAKVKSGLTEARDRTTAGSCECAQLVETVLILRLRHWRCTGDVPRTFWHLVESAAACVYLQNDARALEYLTEAKCILEKLKEGKPVDPGNVQICGIQQAFVHRLTGEILFKAGKLLEAEENFKEALKILNCKLPRNSVAQSFKLRYEKLKKLHYRFKPFQILEERKLDCLQECFGCLSFLWQIGCVRGRLRSASLAITMEINLAFQSVNPFMILYSVIDYLKYSQFIGEESECKRLEAFLCRTCASLSDDREGRRLVSHLTRTLAVVKMCTGDLEQSIECTMRAQQLSEVQNRPGLDARTTAALHLPLLLTDRYSESVQQIQTLENLSKEMSSSVAKGWFYAACMNFLLYAGFAFRPFEECLAFVEESWSDADLEADKSLMLHLYSAVALWYGRLENWAKSAVFFDKAYKVYAQIPTSIESISGVVMLLECSVLVFRKDLTECNRQRRITLKRARKIFSDFTQRFGRNHIFAPRVLDLNAYLHQLTGRKTLAQDLLKEALVLCEKQGNLLDQMWIRESQVDCSGACSHTPAEWSTAVLSMPRWDKAAKLQPEELLDYRFHLKQAEVTRRSHIL
ncbi:adenylate cyclase type 10-like isoform X1 [Ictalurus furcatus]|uniref:adenylate cyclase type 10-like isoform X1 n=3 Tax=Ictalurus furcatus TaxID=66913 RepID=UPI0023504CF9|nr:adenylate cyclase type 10-like isoform X1 [Ictalurus furcatus]